jgi:Polyketide cyclase / dehydrase and lipid transport
MSQLTEIDPKTKDVRINALAPVIVGGEIEIDASPEVVWEVLSTIEHWPNWNPNVRSASIEGKLRAGTAFRWKGGPALITSKLICVDGPRQIAWTGKTMGIKVIHLYRLESRDGKTVVRTEESVEGITARLFRRPVTRSMDSAIEVGLQGLKSEAERRAAG